MKKLFLASLFLVLLIGGGYVYFREHPKNPIPIEMVAFNSLTDAEQNKIIVSPKDSTVEKMIFDEELSNIIKKSYDKKKVYAVTFNHTATDNAGDLVVYVDLDKETVVGKGFKNQ